MRKRLRKKLGRWNAKEWRARGFVDVREYKREGVTREELDSAIAVLAANGVEAMSGPIRFVMSARGRRAFRA